MQAPRERKTESPSLSGTLGGSLGENSSADPGVRQAAPHR